MFFYSPMCVMWFPNNINIKNIKGFAQQILFDNSSNYCFMTNRKNHKIEIFKNNDSSWDYHHTIDCSFDSIAINNTGTKIATVQQKSNTVKQTSISIYELESSWSRTGIPTRHMFQYL